jgi:uncharacterized protein YcsI (UPF0317 family)
MQNKTPLEIRHAIRSGQLNSNTSGLAGGYVQANLAILPADWAAEFLLFCQLNPKPCPLVGVSANPGDIAIAGLAEDMDIRTDVPRYKIFEHGELVREVEDIREQWRDDLVIFALGCSFSFEEALLADGLEIRNVTEAVNVPMYPADAIRAIQICSRFPSVHGAPVHFGDPAAIGIRDIGRPDFGDAVSIRPGEVPVFWACGVTPQVAIEQARPPFCITHSPGHMLVTDLLNSKLSVL